MTRNSYNNMAYHNPPSYNNQHNLGTKAYINEIENIENQFGGLIALKRIMTDVNGYSEDALHHLKYHLYPNFYTLCTKVNQLVTHLDITKNVISGYSQRNIPIYKEKFIDEFKEIHYFRNKLNKAPQTLEQLLVKKEHWELCSPIKAAFHMNVNSHCIYGTYNLKFVSKDTQFFEAVYNKQGILLTEKNDPINMGTYNYVGFDNASEHNKYDVEPYYLWGNTKEIKGKGKATTLANALKNIILFNHDNGAQQHYNQYSEIMQ